MLQDALKSHRPEVASDRTQPVWPVNDTVSSSCCFGGSHATTLWSRVPANSCKAGTSRLSALIQVRSALANAHQCDADIPKH